MKQRLDGSMTVFYAVIFSSVIVFLLALFSFGRVTSMKTAARRDLDLAAYSSLAEYQKEWVREYGLYMVPEGRLRAGLPYYLESNSRHGFDTYDYEVLIQKESTLAEAEALEAEIRRFMKERGVLSMMEEVLRLLQDAEESGISSEAEKFLESSSELVEIQTYYAELVTVMEGVRGDGFKEPYYVNGLWKEDPSYDAVSTILHKMAQEAGMIDEAVEADPAAAETITYRTVASGELGDLERAEMWLEEVIRLCARGEDLAALLIEETVSIEAGDNAEATLDMIPFTAEEMAGYQRILHQNGEKAEKALNGLLRLIAMLDHPTSREDCLDAIETFESIEAYDRSIDLPYEYREGTKAVDLRSILAYVKGYPADVFTFAPDEERDLGESQTFAEASESEELSAAEAASSLRSLSLGESFEAAYLTGEYAVGMFRNFRETVAEAEGETPRNLRGDKKENRFFLNEAEFMIVGSCNEYRNVSATRNRIVLIRTLLNMSYLLTDAAKRQEIEALAAATGGILLPGVGDAIAFGAILTAWSMAEATADYRRLIDGGRIPLCKDAQSWQTDLPSVISMALSEGEEGGGKGWNYEQYLKLLLYLTPRETRLERIGLLLSLNHGGCDLSEAVVSFSVSGMVSGPKTMELSGTYGYAYDDP